MKVLLKPELEKFVTAKVKAGQYADPSAMVNEALEVLKEQHEFTPEHETYLRNELRRGLEQLDRGQRASFDAESIISEERRHLSKKKRRR